MRYTVVLRRDEEGNWLAAVPTFPGCHTWGTTKKEALANAREAIEGCIESLISSGDPVPVEEPAVEIAVVSVA